MVILASDTSTSNGSVAVRDSDGRIVLVDMDSSKPHSETLLPAVQKALSIAGLERLDVQALAVGTGPGAFTGLRVGLATFKGWAFASQLPVLPVPSLDAVAFPVLKEGKNVIVIADARKGEVYICYYRTLDINGIPARQRTTELVSICDIRAWVDSLGDEDAVILGTGVPFLDEVGMAGWSQISEGRSGQPSASEILSIGEIMFTIDRSIEPASLVPDYVRPPDARPQGPTERIMDP